GPTANLPAREIELAFSRPEPPAHARLPRKLTPCRLPSDSLEESTAEPSGERFHMLDVHRLPALPRLARAGAWASLLSARIEPVDVAGFDPEVAPALVSGSLGPVELIRLDMGRCTIERGP